MDKRSDQILVKLDKSDNTLERIEYDDLIYYSCETKCRHNYELYKSTKICVKDPVEFKKELIALNIPLDEVSSTDSNPLNKAWTEDLNNDHLNDRTQPSSTDPNPLSTKIEDSSQDSNPLSDKTQPSSTDPNPLSTKIQGPSQDSNQFNGTGIQESGNEQSSTKIVNQQEKPSNNKLIIMWIIFGCLAVIIVIVLIVLKMKNFF